MPYVFDSSLYAYNPFIWPPLIVGALIAGLGMSVFTLERDSRVSLAFSLFTTCCAFWLLTYVAIFSARNPAVAAGLPKPLR